MPFATLNPPMRPSPGTGHAPEIALRQASFGDGYIQASPAGLNHIRRVVTFMWDFLTFEEARQIESFLVAQGGCRPFWYQLNGESTPRKWICEEWTLTEGTQSRITAIFKESFVPGE